jgi:hypothetical protein
MVFILNSDYVYARKRWVESFEREIKMLREREVKKKCVYGKEKKKEKRKKKKRIKGKKEEWQEACEEDDSSE